MAKKIAVRFSLFSGIGIGGIFCAVFLDYALSFYYGSILVGDGDFNSTTGRAYTVGDVLVIFFSIMIGGFSLGQATPCIKNFALGQ